jgi:hypothetical protein
MEAFKPVQVVSATADFYPEHAPEGFIEWTFLVPKCVAVSAGVFELRWARNLSEHEREGRDYSDVIRAALAKAEGQ